MRKSIAGLECSDAEACSSSELVEATLIDQFVAGEIDLDRRARFVGAAAADTHPSAPAMAAGEIDRNALAGLFGNCLRRCVVAVGGGGQHGRRRGRQLGKGDGQCIEHPAACEFDPQQARRGDMGERVAATDERQPQRGPSHEPRRHGVPPVRSHSSATKTGSRAISELLSSLA